MKKGGLTAKLVEEKLRAHRGNMAAVGRELGVTREAVYHFCKSRPTLQAVCIAAREAMKDDAEKSLHELVLDKDLGAVIFYLKTQAKDRGYIEQTRTTIDVPTLDAEIGRLLAIVAGGSQAPLAAPPPESSTADAGTG